jgi:HAD superfamily hydrolase (TIGR01509 family)
MLNFDAAIFDMDGVVTRTAVVHSLAWKRMFDEYLRYREREYHEPFREFTHADDYLSFVDGRPRYQGVDAFLKSRGIRIPFGDPGDEPGSETVCGLGNWKDEFFNQVLEEEGVGIYDSSVRLINELLARGVRVGVATSSKNCGLVLEKAGITHLFATRVDGVVSAELGLRGKPEPDIFTTASDNLGVKHHRAIVVEDAVSGVQAGAKGRFGLVIGVAREDNALELKNNGADFVVEDLSEISVDEINKLVGSRQRERRAAK